MIPAVTTVRLTGARDRASLPLLVLGPAPGTSATDQWSACAAGLVDAFDVVAWDPPGQGHNRAVPNQPPTTGELATGVLRAVDAVLEQRGELGGPFVHVGVSLGGEVGLRLLLEHPHRVTALVLMGSDDDDATRAPLRAALDGVPAGRLVEVGGEASRAPVGSPEAVVLLLRHHLLGEPLETDGLTAALRREAATHDRDSVWARPALDRRSRWLVTLAALAAGRHHDELPAQVRAALGDGVTTQEVTELLLHVTTYGMLPDDGTARLVHRALTEEEDRR